jgi:hypothetical protein
MNIKAKKGRKQYRTPKEMTIAAGKAMKEGFYTETIWILSGIMELKLKKMIILTEGKTPGAAFGLEQCLKRIRNLQSKEKYAILKDEFPLPLIVSLRNWKNNRNIMMKDMLEMHVSGERKERLAKEGIGLLKALNKLSKRYKMAFHEPGVEPSSAQGDTGSENIPDPADSSALGPPVQPTKANGG